MLWININAGVAQGSILGPILFLICSKDLTIILNPKLFADDTSLFSTVKMSAGAANKLNN